MLTRDLFVVAKLFVLISEDCTEAEVEFLIEGKLFYCVNFLPVLSDWKRPVGRFDSRALLWFRAIYADLLSATSLRRRSRMTADRALLRKLIGGARRLLAAPCG